MLNIQQKSRTQTRGKTRHGFCFLPATFLPLCISPSSLPSSSISPGNTALIIAELHRDNRLLESRAVAAEAVWENPSCLLQPARLPADCACMRVCYSQSILHEMKQRTLYIYRVSLWDGSVECFQQNLVKKKKKKKVICMQFCCFYLGKSCSRQLQWFRFKDGFNS